MFIFSQMVDFLLGHINVMFAVYVCVTIFKNVYKNCLQHYVYYRYPLKLFTFYRRNTQIDIN